MLHSADTEQADETMVSNPAQLDLETAARQVETQATGQEKSQQTAFPLKIIQQNSQLTAQAETHEQATIIRRPTYIPAASKDVGTDDEVVSAATESAARPSLLNRFSGIWSSKPTDKLGAAQAIVKEAQDKPAEKTEPVLKRADVTLPKVEEPVIMDLPTVDVVQPSLPVTAASPEDHEEDDDLDIPAFLRRQAN